MLPDAEAQQEVTIVEAYSLANMVTQAEPIANNVTTLAYHHSSASRGHRRGHSSRSRIQCQLYGETGHLVD
ncbi:hypothetical protein J1N35_037189 [Gossypium stocksii]|uniref:Uncharacterized protein n=1 Tax=Gossypium stocksii TaxID=47602 RepID=A0A9D3UJE4_9ROSI|nr:hypothetical protein J1N35_037189 [Gossypium stocksii]